MLEPVQLGFREPKADRRRGQEQGEGQRQGCPTVLEPPQGGTRRGVGREVRVLGFQLGFSLIGPPAGAGSLDPRSGLL